LATHHRDDFGNQICKKYATTSKASLAGDDVIVTSFKQPFSALDTETVSNLENLVKPSEMPRQLALTGITAHTQKHFTSGDKTQKEKNIYISDSELYNATSLEKH